MKNKNIVALIMHLHPFQRILWSFILAAILFFSLQNTQLGLLFRIIATWCVFAFSYLMLAWIIMFGKTVDQIKKTAKTEDGSRIFVIIFTIIAAFAAIITVLLLIISASNNVKKELITVLTSFLSVLLSWVLVHTIFAFHYAHYYYDDDIAAEKQNKEGLSFPSEKNPDYLDFAYFSFVIGMTFQVSDVEITQKKMRRLVLLHGLLAFLLNTFVVALSVNFIAGLSK